MDYIKPRGQLAPQLSKGDLANLTPEEIVAADELGQFDVVQTGRDPLAFEISGERKATPEEDAQARADQAQAARVASNQNRQAQQLAHWQERHPL